MMIVIVNFKLTFARLHLVHGVISLTQILECEHQLFSTVASLSMVHIYLHQHRFQNDKPICLYTYPI